LCVYQFMNMGVLSVFYSLQILSSMDCSFPSTGLSFPLLSLFLDLFEVITNGVIFLYYLSTCSLLVYRKATDFCKLILYPTTLLKLFMVPRCFLGLFSIVSCLQIQIIWLLFYLLVFLLFLLPVLFRRLCWIEWTVLSCSWH
jgi:hypothetical protein